MSNIAVISLAGAQYLVKPGMKLEVNRLVNNVDEAFTPEVLLSTDNDNVLFNEGTVETKVVDQIRGEKIFIIKFKAKSRYRRRTGHRQYLSVLEIVSINGQKAEARKAAKTKSVDAQVEVAAVSVKKPVKKATVKAKVKKETSK
jgi:large subunit ribosomal protein L21